MSKFNTISFKQKYYDENMFIKILPVEKMSKNYMKLLINKTLEDFKGLTHYEIIKYGGKKYIIFYYINKTEGLSGKPIQFKLAFLKLFKSALSNNVYVYLREIEGIENLRFFLKGKLIHSSICNDKNLHKYYINIVDYIKSIFGESIRIVQTRDDAFKIYTEKEDKLKSILKGVDNNIFTEKQKLSK